jgi:lysophospholipase
MGRRDEGFFSAKDNLRLFWASELPDSPKAHVGLVHGYADHSGRYRQTVERLARDGFAVHVFDYRGHGRADGRRGYCERFVDLVDDLDAFWRRVRQAAGSQKSFLVAHSNGALMTIQWLARKPEGLAGLVLSAPYLKLAITPPPLKVLSARLVGKVIPWIPVKTEITAEQLTSNVEEQRLAVSDPLYLKIVTPRWFTESTAAQEDASRAGPSLTVPVFVFCGEDDQIASPPAARAFFDSIGSADKKFKQYSKMRHEPLNEVAREEVWADISGWISAHL